jgi:DNA-binding CsgD family transcriptional regulator
MQPRDETLIRSIVEGVREASPWRAFARELRVRFAASYTNVSFRRAESPHDIAIWDADGVPGELRERYFEQFRDKDPIRYEALPLGRAVTIEELVEDSEHCEFQTHYLKWAGMDRLMILHVEAAEGLRAWLTVARPESGAPFTPDDRALLELVGRFFSPSLEVYAALQQAEFEQALHARATRSLGVGVMVLDQTGAAIQVSEEARLKLAGQSELRIDRGRLRARERGADLELRERIAVLLQQPRGVERSFSMSIGEEAPLDVLMCSVSAPLGFACAAEPKVAVYVSSGPDAVIAQARRLEELFQLTSREAALAALLAGGRTLSEAADELHITEQTARTYSKRIFLKTGVRRQTDLVRRILTGVACLSAVGDEGIVVRPLRAANV